MEGHIVNLRDIGGYQGLYGKHVKKGLLLRSGELCGLCRGDKEMLRERYHLGLILDLRKQEEVNERPDDVIEGAAYRHLNIMEAFEGRSTGKYDLIKTAGSVDADRAMQSLYREIVKDMCARQRYAEFLRLLLSEPDGQAAIFHCFAGKDRTGLGAALILGLLGVSYGDIMHDYLLTNAQRAEENERLIEAERRKGAPEAVLSALHKIFNVDASYLDAAKAEMEASFGELESFAREALGLSESEIKQFREKYLE